jgi:hypothetical protein
MKKGQSEVLLGTGTGTGTYRFAFFAALGMVEHHHGRFGH